MRLALSLRTSVFFAKGEVEVDPNSASTSLLTSPTFVGLATDPTFDPFQEIQVWEIGYPITQCSVESLERSSIDPAMVASVCVITRTNRLSVSVLPQVDAVQIGPNSDESIHRPL